MRSLSVLLGLLLLLVGLSAVIGGYHDDIMDNTDPLSREQVIQNLARRKTQLETLLAETRKTIAQHHSGENKLEMEEKERLEKRIDVIKKKLERMEDVDEREIERMRQRETRRYQRRRERATEL